MEAIEKYLKSLDEADLHEKRIDHPLALDLDPAHLPDPQKLKERIAYHESVVRQLNETSAHAILHTDPEAGLMPAKEGGVKPCYNVQTAVDTASHMIVDFDVTNNASDRGTLNRTAEKCKKELGLSHVNVIADKGYESGPDIEACLMNGTVADVGFIYDRDDRAFSLDYEEITPEEAEKCAHSDAPESIQQCLKAGILPDCMKGSNVRIEVQSLDQMSCFLRHEDGRVTCPMGRELFKRSDKKYGTDYSSRDACRTCPNRCTDSSKMKTVQIGYESNCVPVLMYGTPQMELQKIPENARISDNNHSLLRGRALKRVMIFIRRDKPKQRLRMQVNEHPFGTMKHYDGAGYFLCKGKEKVTAEYALSCLGYNIRRAITMCGSVAALMERFKGITLPKMKALGEI